MINFKLQGEMPLKMPLKNARHRGERLTSILIAEVAVSLLSLTHHLPILSLILLSSNK